MIARIEAFLLKRYGNQQYLFTKKAHYLLRFNFVVLIICVIGLVFHNNLSEIRFYVISLISFSSVLIFLIRGNLNHAVWLAVYMISLDILADILQFNFTSYEKIVETIMESFLAYILVGLVAMNKRQIIYTVVANTILTMLHAFLLFHVAYSHIPLPEQAYRYFIGGVTAVLLVGFIVLANAKVHDEALMIVQGKNELLTLNNNELEELVKTRTSELEMANQKLERVNNELFRMSMHDQLTGIFNRRKILQKADQIVGNGKARGVPVSVAMLDIDHFKRINDTYGHKVGDLAIKSIVDVCKISLQEIHFIGRIGGEEFLIVLDKTPIHEAHDILEQLKDNVDHALIDISGGNLLHLTVSIGVSELRGGESLEDVIHRADIALYDSKRNGRNRVTLFDALKLLDIRLDRSIY